MFIYVYQTSFLADHSAGASTVLAPSSHTSAVMDEMSVFVGVGEEVRDYTTSI